MSAALKIDRKLHANTPEASARKGYDIDAEAIAKVLVKHYGDEADSVLKLALRLLDNVRKTKR